MFYFESLNTTQLLNFYFKVSAKCIMINQVFDNGKPVIKINAASATLGLVQPVRYTSSSAAASQLLVSL